MTDLRFTLVADGPSDQVLLCPLAWLLRQHVTADLSIQPQWADLRPLRERPRGLRARIEAAIDLYPCQMLFVHRDAERQDPASRYQEISQAAEAVAVDLPPLVPVVPVRMTEAWLLFDEQAVRRAAGNPNGSDPLRVPIPQPEDLADPKQVLHEALRTASGLSGRRRHKFNVRDAVHRVAEYVEDFAPLRELSAFRSLEEDLARVLGQGGWT